MLRKLLAERFGFRVHIVQKDFPVYALVVDKSPPKIKVSAPSLNEISFLPGTWGMALRRCSFPTPPCPSSPKS